jgi:hypothetical protein
VFRRAARAARLFKIICFIAPLMILGFFITKPSLAFMNASFDYEEAIGTISVAKPCKSFAPKNVSIADYSPDVISSAFLLDDLNRVGTLNFGVLTKIHSYPRRNIIALANFFFLNWEILSLQIRTKVLINEPADIFCDTPAHVFDIYSPNGIGSSRQRKNTPRFNGI